MINKSNHTITTVRHVSKCCSLRYSFNFSHKCPELVGPSSLQSYAKTYITILITALHSGQLPPSSATRRAQFSQNLAAYLRAVLIKSRCECLQASKHHKPPSPSNNSRKICIWICAWNNYMSYPLACFAFTSSYAVHNLRLLLLYYVIPPLRLRPSFSSSSFPVRHFLVRHFPVLQIPPLRLCPPFSSPANSTPATLSVIFQSCKFHPCDFVRHFPVLQIPVLQIQLSLTNLLMS